MQDKQSDQNNKIDRQASSAPPVPDSLVTDDMSSPAYGKPDDSPAIPSEPVAFPRSPQQNTKNTASESSNPIKRFLSGYWHHKKWTLPLTLLVILGVMAATPQTRYPILALGLKRNFAVTVMDSKTNTPVSGATVMLDGQTATTNNGGKASFAARVGKRTLTITKRYYKNASASVFVGIATTHNSNTIQLTATGRQVPVKVINKITGKPVANADIKVIDTEAKTDNAGKATIVLPTAKSTQAITIQADGYNTFSGLAQVTDKVVDANTFAITPAGRVYFLSNLSGKIDVVSANLDGTSRKTILAGTGKEDANNTVLLASRDWKYLALLSKRAGGQYDKLYLIATDKDQVTTMDDSAAYFTPIGWSDHYFVYKINRPDVQNWQPNGTSIISYNAESAKAINLVSTTATGTSNADALYENIWDATFLGDRLVYATTWYQYPGYTTVTGKQNNLVSISPDGTGSKTIKTLDSAQNYFSSLKLAKPDTLYLAIYSNTSNATNYYRLDTNGNLTQSSIITADTVNRDYPTYLISPNDKETLWNEVRDGKNTLFVGDYNGNNGNQIASLSDYAPFGWYTDDYLLVQKSGSELYVLPASGGTALKISDYYKPPRNFPGYGGGYGGL